MDNEDKAIVKLLVKTVVGIIAFFLLLGTFTIIKANERGILLTFGEASNKTLPSGINFKIPLIQKVVKIDLQPQQLYYTIPVGNDGAITKDNQTIGAMFSVFYLYQEDKLVEMYKSIGEDKIKSIITQVVNETFKAEIGKFDIFKLPMSQDEIRKSVFAIVTEKLAKYPIQIAELQITNYDWSDEFDSQIATTMARAQEVKQKEQELLISQNEQLKKVKAAEAEKQALITKAEGEKEAARLNAEAKALEGEGIRKYNESVSKNIDFELKKIQLEIDRIRAEKWNGQQVPSQVFTPIPLDLKGTLKESN